MAVLNQFQQYSQGENTVTNNVLLMLSNLYEINPKYYEEYIRGLTEDSDNYEVIPTFLQQFNNRGDGFIDGHIQIKASKIIIETKLHGLEWIDKLLKYSKSFDHNEYKLLFHLSSSKYPQSDIEKINTRLKNGGLKGKVNFHSITYQDLVDQLKELAKNYTYEQYLQRLNEHFEAYCLGMGLMPRSSHILRAMACGQSFDLNVKHKFYFDLASRGYSDFNYLGIYKWKSVRYIGKVENVIVANWDETEGLEVLDKKFDITKDQENRLIDAIKESIENGWGVDNDHRFFLLKDFEETDFNKTSPGGIFRVRFFNLEDYFDEVPKNMKELALQLKTKSWE
ncbi:hypothetical protein NE848_04155 [Gramella jeungdoensis]|uniref:Uncharacterized protein n=1 Tax=Gramella jeungdoensis TaxID=708091 RepID=A0ABT0Z075_9FLAO|nr:hypothetical protein [Gramella jeungdoensis]MCM8568557.1 hypothetical protein [Gramella jeungdoensis]